MGSLSRRARRQAERDRKRESQPQALESESVLKLNPKERENRPQSWDPDVVPKLTHKQRAELADFHDKVKAAQREASIDMIKQGATPLDLAVNAGGFAEDVFPKSAGRKHWKCAEGCSWCCHQQVSVTAVEAIALADDLRQRLTEEWFKAVREKVAAKASEIAKLANANQYDQARIACAMLSDDGRCSAYARRPIMCRSYASFSVESCKAYYDQPDKGYAYLDEFAHHVGLGVLGGVKEALAAAGHDANTYEFHSALLRALDVPDAAARWSRGENVFDGCKPSMSYKQAEQ